MCVLAFLLLFSDVMEGGGVAMVCNHGDEVAMASGGGCELVMREKEREREKREGSSLDCLFGWRRWCRVSELICFIFFFTHKLH